MKIVVDWFRIGLDSNFHGLEEYARILEDQIERLTNAERLRIKRASHADEAEWQIAWDEHRWLFEMVLPRTLRYSCIVSLFTTLETAMNSLCQELRSRKGLRLSVRELKAEPFERTSIYIKKVAGIDIPDHPFTVALQSLNKVRNCIVHTGGNLEEYSDPKGIKQHVGKLEGLSVSHDGYIEVSKGTCQELVQSAYKWIDCLCEACGLGRKNPDVGRGSP